MGDSQFVLPAQVIFILIYLDFFYDFQHSSQNLETPYIIDFMLFYSVKFNYELTYSSLAQSIFATMTKYLRLGGLHAINLLLRVQKLIV